MGPVFSLQHCIKLSMMVYSYNTNSREVEVKDEEFRGHPCLHRNF